MTILQSKTHLEFYRQHQIAPVHYNLSDMQAHLERRASLYLKLGLSPLAFRSANVLEVAAGTGHNSLYLAQTLPKKLTLLEPHALGVEKIREAYKNFDRKHTDPTIVNAKLEDYYPHEQFDIVLCENWLGNSEHELSLVQKLSSMVAPQGMLVLTTVSPIGLVPNLLRRFLSLYLAPISDTFEERTQKLVQVFGPHLDTLPAMTRNKVDWVQDNMLNPAYFGLCLSIPEVITQLKDRFMVIGSCPDIAEDWRWFKGLHGKERQFNAHFLNEYWKKAHNFLDCRESITNRDEVLNQELEKRAIDLRNAIEKHEEAHLNEHNIEESRMDVRNKLESFLDFVPEHCILARRGLQEVYESLSSEIIDPFKLCDFSSLFGRETTYLSLYNE